MFNTNKTKKIVAVGACVLTMGGMMFSANAETFKNTGTTEVIYDSRKIVPGGPEGDLDTSKYGIAIPATINFNDGKDSSDATLEIVTLNGGEWSDWSSLQVKTSVQSNNNFEMVNADTVKVNGQNPTYELNMNGNGDLVQQINKNGNTGAEAVALEQILGVGGDTVKKIPGTADLVRKAENSGVYKDTLTFTFEELANQAAQA